MKPINSSSQSATERSVEWIYRGIWRVLVDWFRVPAQPPSLPHLSATGVLQSFRPSAAFLRYLKFQFWIALVVIDVLLTAAWIAIFIASPMVGLLVTPIALAIIVVPDIVAYIAIHLRYDTTWYVISDRSLRIRRGIWVIRETTLTYENIQNVKVVQGPLERYFGIANVIVETAGGGGGGDAAHGTQGSHVGMIEGVDNAAQIRELIMARTSASQSTGLGNPDEQNVKSTGPVWTAAQMEVLREIAALVKT
jgi:membrane protein YdbS with pleckstrin-like domain